MPLVASCVSRSCIGGSRRPRQPSRTPMTSSPCCSPRRTTARITALRPGQSPPPVKTAIFMAVEQQDARVPSRIKRALSDHLYGSEKEVLFAVRLLFARLAGRPLEPLTGDHLAVMPEPREQRCVAGAQVALHQGLQERLELVVRHRGVTAGVVQLAVEGVGDVQQLVQQGLDPLLRRRGAEKE